MTFIGTSTVLSHLIVNTYVRNLLPVYIFIVPLGTGSVRYVRKYDGRSLRHTVSDFKFP